MDITQLILFSTIIFIAYFIQGVTGFGSAIFALPLATIFLPLKNVIPVLLIFGVLQNIIIVIKDKQYINKEEAKKIVFFILIGAPLGILFFNVLPENILKFILSMIIIVIAFSKLLSSNNKVESKVNRFDFLYLIFGGCMHGAFGTGGPLIVVYIVKRIQNKSSFRVTMCFIWTIINIVLIVQKALTGWFNYNVFILLMYGVIFVILGTYVGNKVHNVVSEEKFAKVSYIILLCSGISLFLNVI